MIPTYEDLMLPLLRLFGDGREHTIRELIASLANEFNLTDEELKQLVPSGRRTLFDDWVVWAKTYIKQAGLLCCPKRSTFNISDRGKKVLRDYPDRIDNAYLERFQEFREFKTRKRNVSHNLVIP